MTSLQRNKFLYAEEKVYVLESFTKVNNVEFASDALEDKIAADFVCYDSFTG